MLKAKAYRVEKKHRTRVFQKGFKAWSELYQYYRNMLGESLSKGVMARVKYLKRYLVAWQTEAKIRGYR